MPSFPGVLLLWKLSKSPEHSSEEIEPSQDFFSSSESRGIFRSFKNEDIFSPILGLLMLLCHYILDHCPCSYQSTVVLCTGTIQRKHWRQGNTHTQKILKLQENDRKCHVEDEWLRNGRMLVCFFSELPVNYKPEFLWKVNVICITLCNTITGHDPWLPNLAFLTWTQSTWHWYRKRIVLNVGFYLKLT